MSHVSLYSCHPTISRLIMWVNNELRGLHIYKIIFIVVKSTYFIWLEGLSPIALQLEDNRCYRNLY